VSGATAGLFPGSAATSAGEEPPGPSPAAPGRGAPAAGLPDSLTAVPSDLAAVFFDMDGLLVDTEPLWFETEIEVMGRLGAAWTRQDQRQLLGGSMPRTVSYLLGKATRPASPQAVERWMMDGMLARAAAGRVTVLPGARELLAEVAAAGLPHALVTSSLRLLAEAVLAGTGLRFPVTVTGDDVPVTKPDPAPYLLAAKLLDVDPARCVALEDSPNGTASATAAGCRVVAVPSFAGIPPAPGRLVVPSLAGLSLAALRALASLPSRGHPGTVPGRSEQ
jgi:HAD superfamily hydrolase (TIGR01509 family)